MIKIFIFDQRRLSAPDFDFGDTEAIRLASLKNPKRQLESTSALCALKRLIDISGYNSKLEILRLDTGKPIFKDSDIAFSLAHSGDISIAAICDENCNNIGIDIEIVTERSNKLEFSERFFSPYEKDEFKNGNFSDESFFKIWTKKEAFAKMKGIGISEILKNDFSSNSSTSFIKSYEFYNKNDRYCLSLCTKSQENNVEFYNNSLDIDLGILI